jgi:hypothetical protein
MMVPTPSATAEGALDVEGAGKAQFGGLADSLLSAVRVIAPPSPITATTAYLTGSALPPSSRVLSDDSMRGHPATEPL